MLINVYNVSSVSALTLCCYCCVQRMQSNKEIVWFIFKIKNYWNDIFFSLSYEMIYVRIIIGSEFAFIYYLIISIVAIYKETELQKWHMVYLFVATLSIKQIKH